MDVNVKEEFIEASELPQNFQTSVQPPTVVDNVISLSSSSSGSSSLYGLDSDDSDMEVSPIKRQKIEDVLPVGFLDPLSPEQRLAMKQRSTAAAAGSNSNNNNNVGFPGVMMSHASVPSPSPRNVGQKLVSTLKKEPSSVVEPGEVGAPTIKSYKQFWKAGDYEGCNGCVSTSQAVGMDHVRIHPRFLHSNATSHKWALGAFAELLDNALDEVSNGATYVHIDMQKNKKDKNAILVVEDDGGGMTPEKIRQCMSFGYSEKSKLANTIGQYGNGFKTSTMRLGADVIVFSRSKGVDKSSATQSIGMLSYTFLRSTGKEDIVVPMIDYEKRGKVWKLLTRSTFDDAKRNLETIVQWSPYESEKDLLQQFDYIKDKGTRIIVYNLWEDDQGRLELDFDSDQHDIQIRGVNRDEKKIEMAKKYPNSRHFLTYRHSLRSYTSILYLRIPPGFRIILRGMDVEHHNIVNDMIYAKEITYRPAGIPDETPKDPNMFAVLAIGFVKDASYHIDVQGFNVYHKNRLIKPFWRVWNAAGSDGRGVIGVLEANFVEPAHDKQSFERTIVFSRLEARLVAFQKDYWTTNCHLVGYAQRRHPKKSVSPEKKASSSANDKLYPRSNSNQHAYYYTGAHIRSTGKYDEQSPAKDAGQNEMERVQDQTPERNDHKTLSTSGETQPESLSNTKTDRIARHSCLKITKSSRDDLELVHSCTDMVAKLKEENQNLKEKLEDVLSDLQYERDKNRSLANKEKEIVFKEERSRQDSEVDTLRNKLKDASDTMDTLLNKVRLLERSRDNFNCKREH